ncbi:aminotransferase class IV [Streptomyces sp. TRM49041]|uniref:aminotransferase class IV n=1 Tax=Streptomyces sp. TRM49041 TaxID=2603216 RepID=UPI001CA46D59|nr:aminotransferase class IV [Streptomyces sp. TRM49041]
MELDGAPATPEALKALALTNYGHFTTVRVENHRVRGLALHLERLERDCRSVFGTPLDTDRVRAYLRRAVAAQPDPCLVRITIYDPALDIADPATGLATPHVLVTTRPAAALPLPPLRVKSTPYVRDQPAIKHTALFGPLHTRRAARLQGFDDALFHDPASGEVTEGPTWNIGFIHTEGQVLWPTGRLLPGVTMKLLQNHDQHATAPVPLPSAHEMQAAFATNTAVGVREISAIDGVPLPTGHPTVTALRTTYESLPGDPV